MITIVPYFALMLAVLALAVAAYTLARCIGLSNRFRERGVGQSYMDLSSRDQMLQDQMDGLSKRVANGDTEALLRIDLLADDSGREFYMTEAVPEQVTPGTPAQLAIRKKKKQ